MASKYDVPDGIEAVGCLPRETTCGSEFPIFEQADGIEPLERREWKETFADNESCQFWNGPIHDQDGEGTCASNATCQATETILNLALGKTSVQLSPISIYRWIARGPQTGSTIDGNLRQLTQVGALPVDNQFNRRLLELAGLDPSHVLRHVGYSQRFPDGWKETAAYFRGVEAYDIESIEGFAAAVARGYPVVYGRSGHAICAVDFVERGRDWNIKYANSWGDWGDDGYGYDDVDKIARAVSSYGAWALRTVRLSDPIMNAVQQLLQEDS